MDIQERVAKVETEVTILKENQKALLEAIAQGFAEQRAATERGFAEQRAALAAEREARERGLADLRREMQTGFRWMFSAQLAVLALVLGIIARLAGAI